MKEIWNWLVVLFSGRPHFYIGGRERPYILRWFLIPRNRWLNIYLHKFMRDDDDRALHDHPWWFFSIMLWGAYRETRKLEIRGRGWVSPYFESTVRRSPSIAFRSAISQHRVELPKRDDGTPLPCWTLVITGPKVRTWGFWCPKGFVPWTEFVSPADSGEIGPGCGE